MKLSTLLLFLFSFQFIYAQTDAPVVQDSSLAINVAEFRKFSFDLSVGHSAALVYMESQKFGINHYKAAVRYMFTESFGLSGGYIYSDYTTANGLLTSKMNSVKFDLVYNIGRSLGLLKTEGSKFTVLSHLGLGYGWHKSPQLESRKAENFLPISIGLTPTFMSSNGLSLFMDFELVNNFQQDVRFDGNFVAPEAKWEGEANGILLNISVGASLSFGGPVRHADFYQKKMALNQ